MQKTPIFSLRNATAGYNGRTVLHDVDLDVFEGETIALMGRSGAGKSTLLNLLHDQRRAEVALVPQAVALVKPLSVFHNVYMGRLDRYSTAYNLRTLVWPTTDELERVSDVLSDVALVDKLRASAGALSGGQQQRVSVARALYTGRPILVGDEPVSALDRVQAGQILELLQQRHMTLVLALHDIPLALEHAHRIVVLDMGRKVIDAPVADVQARDLFAHFGGAP